MECDKANILNTFFQSQTVLNEQNANLPDLPDINRLNSHLESIVLSGTEVESVLKSLAVGKASGPNGLSNRILRELSKELSKHFVHCSTNPYDQAHSLHHIKKLMFVDQFPYLTLRVKY